MQLKAGIILLGFSFGVALFVPRDNGGLIAVITLLVMAMVLVATAPAPQLRDEEDASDVYPPEPGPEGFPPPGEPELRDSPVRRGRHSKDHSLGHPDDPATQSGL